MAIQEQRLGQKRTKRRKDRSAGGKLACSEGLTKKVYASNTSTLPTDPLNMDSDKVTQILCGQGILR